MKTDPGTNFVVLTSQRSGSAWLISVINAIEDAAAYGELFLRRTRDAGSREWDADFAYPRFVEAGNRNHGLRPFSVFSYLDALYQRAGTVGFKLMYSQCRLYPEVWAYLVWHRVHVVHLVRRNHLDVVISREIAARIGHAHVLIGERPVGEVQVELKPGTLTKKLDRLNRNIRIARRLLRLSRLPHLEVAYEDLLEDQDAFNAIWKFLSVNPSRSMPRSNLARIRKGDHEHVISNYSEIKHMLATSKFAHLIK